MCRQTFYSNGRGRFVDNYEEQRFLNRPQFFQKSSMCSLGSGRTEIRNRSKIQLNNRVAREKGAHTDSDILGNSRKVKDFFRHISTSPTMIRLEEDFSRYLSDVQDAHVLDIGCGHGEQSLLLLKHGAKVTGIDISQNYIEDARQAAMKSGYSNGRFDFRTMDAHSLDFPPATFDLVIGRGILHHLDLELALSQIHLVLKTGGRAIFQEPLAGNPLLKLFRLLTPHARTKDEKPLSPEDLRMIEANWIAQTTFYGLISAPVAILTSIALRPFENNIFLRIADRIEQKINRIPAVRPFNQYVVLNLIRK